MGRTIFFGFLAGFVAVLVFHQGTAWLLHVLAVKAQFGVGVFGRAGAPFSMAPVQPFGVPTLLSAAFWGGVWGIALAAILRGTRLPDLLFGFVFGALVLTLVAFTVAATLKGQPLFAGYNQRIWWRALLLNGAWGWGTALLLRPLRRF